MTLKDFIRFIENKHPSIISPISYVRERNHILELISMVYDQDEILVLPNKIIV